jgi:hypothetical protein
VGARTRRAITSETDRPRPTVGDRSLPRACSSPGTLGQANRRAGLLLLSCSHRSRHGARQSRNPPCLVGEKSTNPHSAVINISRIVRIALDRILKPEHRALNRRHLSRQSPRMTPNKQARHLSPPCMRLHFHERATYREGRTATSSAENRGAVISVRCRRRRPGWRAHASKPQNHGTPRHGAEGGVRRLLPLCLGACGGRARLAALAGARPGSPEASARPPRTRGQGLTCRDRVARAGPGVPGARATLPRRAPPYTATPPVSPLLARRARGQGSPRRGHARTTTTSLAR